MSTTDPSCQNCQYYRARAGGETGTCHIRAPQVVTVINVKGVGTPGTGWPVVQGNSGCGEFKQKPQHPSQGGVDIIKQVISQ